MRRLVLMRHAKSSWDAPAAPDHDRPLNQRGRLAAALMGAWLREQPWRLDVALISTSARTRETWARMWVSADMVDFRAELYHAEPDALWAAARSAPPEAQTTFLLAHNPGLEFLLGAMPRGPRRAPTAMIAVLAIDGDWSAAGPERARLVEYEEPKGLV